MKPSCLWRARRSRAGEAERTKKRSLEEARPTEANIKSKVEEVEKKVQSILSIHWGCPYTADTSIQSSSLHHTARAGP